MARSKRQWATLSPHTCSLPRRVDMPLSLATLSSPQKSRGRLREAGPRCEGWGAHSHNCGAVRARVLARRHKPSPDDEPSGCSEAPDGAPTPRPVVNETRARDGIPSRPRGAKNGNFNDHKSRAW